MADEKNSVEKPVGPPQDLKDFADLVALCKRRGFVFPSSEVYGGINACWDYGPLGIELKRNIKERWWRAMCDREDIEGLDAAILMHPKVWEASGHVATFSDPLIDNKTSKARYRVDHLIEGEVARLRKKGQTNNAEALAKKLDETKDPDALHKIVIDFQIKDPVSGTTDWTEVRKFNLMFKTFMGPVEDSANIVYLRPETAQGIYVNFLNVQQSARQKLPFGIAQIGKAFRNEITPGNFIFRTREFEQMEMQYFVKPGTDMEWFEKWKEMRVQWHLDNGIRRSKLRFHEHGPTELAHYARAAFDIQYEFPIGWQEVEGIHNRSDFDLSRHQEYSGKRLEYFDEATKEHYVPYIVETSVGCDRALLVALVDSYRFDGDRTWLQMHPALAPYKVAVYPLMKKPELTEYSDKVLARLKKRFRVTSDDAGSIGKRYRRQDEIGTPFGVTIDYDTLSNHTVTIRHRDTMVQERISVEKIEEYIQERFENWNQR